MAWFLLIASALGFVSGQAARRAGSAPADVGRAPTDHVERVPLTTDSLPSLVRAAALIEAAEPRLETVWPDFWPEQQPYLVQRGDDALLVADRRPSSDWRPVRRVDLPETLSGRAFRRSGPLSRLAGGFDMDYSVADLTVAAVRWSDDTFHTLKRLFHEWFHVVQRERFDATRGSGGLPPQVETHLPAEAISDPRFRTLAEVERRLLREALAASDDAPRREILRSYLAVRSRRMEMSTEEVRRAEINIERKEGSAEYVGLAAAVLATGRGSGRVLEATDELLAMRLDSTGFGASAYAEFRARLYGTGASQAHLLDRLAPRWKDAVADGTPFPALVASALGFSPDRAQRDGLADSALARHGYPEILARERQTAERGEREEAEDPHRTVLHSGRVTLVLELLPEDPRIVNRMQFDAEGGFGREVESGLLLSRDPAVVELSLPGVAATIRDASTLLDVRSAPDTIRLVVPSPRCRVSTAVRPKKGRRSGRTASAWHRKSCGSASRACPDAGALRLDRRPGRAVTGRSAGPRKTGGGTTSARGFGDQRLQRPLRGAVVPPGLSVTGHGPPHPGRRNAGRCSPAPCATMPSPPGTRLRTAPAPETS